MGKMYELLAVQESKKHAFGKILEETLVVFSKKAQGHFTGAEKTLTMFAEEDANESGIAERHDMTTTVHAKLDYLLGRFVAPYLDVMLQKEATNQNAYETLTIGKTEIEHVPATFMLGFVDRLKAIRSVVNAIPTLSPGVEWIEDEGHKLAPHVRRNKVPQEQSKTRKVLVPFELSPATKEHRAQVKELSEDRVVGKFALTIWSSMYSPKEKSDILARIDKLIEDTDVSRQRANAVEASTARIGDVVANYLLNG